MRARRALWLCGAVLLAQSAHAVELSDDRGVAVQLAAPAQRIVALAPHLTEIAFAAGAGGRLVGVARFSDFPEGARAIPQVGDASRVDIERVLLLRPDLVLAWRSGNPAGDIARLEHLKFRMFVTEPRRIDDIARLLRSVGALAGSVPAAEDAARAFEAGLTELRARYATRAPVRVFYEIWHRPLLTVSGGHMIGDVIRACGGVNVFEDAPQLAPAVALESMLAARPEAIIGGGSADTQEIFVARWRRYAIAELKRLPVFFIAPDDIQRSTPRILDGARAICRSLDEVRSRREPATSVSRTGP